MLRLTVMARGNPVDANGSGSITARIPDMRPTLADRLRHHGLEFSRLDDPSEAAAIDRNWRDTFASHPKTESTIADFGGYRWNIFSFHLQPCYIGEAAWSAYQGQWQASFFVFDESLDFCACCPPQSYPDLSAFGQDLYVAHHHMKWTMVFAHEQPSLGPFFAQRSNV